MDYPRISTFNKIIYIKGFNELDLSDTIFDTLKDEYEEFHDWFAKMASNGATAYVILGSDNKTIESITSVKETKADDDKDGLKIRIIKTIRKCHFAEFAFKLGIWKTIEINERELFFTHFTDPNHDSLKEIALTYGFKIIRKNERGEEIFQKKLAYNNTDDTYANYPFIKKSNSAFIVPIQKDYADILLQNIFDKSRLFDDNIMESPEGNGIEKVYICASNIRTMQKNDILFFYRSVSEQGIVAVGVLTEFQEVNSIKDFEKVEGRSVFDKNDILKLINQGKKLIIIKFLHSINLTKLVDINTLNISIPQTICSLSKNDADNVISKVDNKWKFIFQ